MRYVCMVTDYDGTLACDSRVAGSTVTALNMLRQSGRKIVLCTGRLLPELLTIFPEAAIFDRIVAENGAVLYSPANRETKLLSEPASQPFVDKLRRRGVPQIGVGQAIVATWRPYEQIVLDVIRELGLGLQVIFNKNAVMILPSGVNKASGMLAALDELGLSAHNIVGIGDAENDHAFLTNCECSVVVSNALPALCERADYVTTKDHGAGVEELISMLLADDLASLEPKLGRHRILLGNEESGAAYTIRPYNSRIIVAGTSGSGKSTTVAALLERLLGMRYQACLIDPEGDYDDFEQFVTLGGPERIPAVSEILEVLKKPGNSMTINLLGVPIVDRPSYFLAVLPALQELRARTGRPHWIVIDEAHHLIPRESKSMSLTIPKDPANLLLITVHPDRVATPLLESMNELLIVGPEPDIVIDQFQRASGIRFSPTKLSANDQRSGNIVAWRFGDSELPKDITVVPAKLELKRHRRKYAVGELGEDKSFYFRGPDGKLNLRAQNLNTFIQLAQGVDDETWLFHLRKHHYSQWFRDSVKDNGISSELRNVESDSVLSVAESKSRIIKMIERHYTAPA